MPDRLPLTVALSLLAFAAAATTADEADACPCLPMPLAPAAGATIPQNATAFPFQMHAGVSVPYPRLLDPLGAERATTVTPDPSWPTGSLLMPAAPLSNGVGYRIVYDETCGASDEQERVFDVGPATPLPTSIGALTAANWAVGPVGGCAPPTPQTAVAIDLEIPASPAMIAWAPLTAFHVFVDGQEVRSLQYGAARRNGNSFLVTRITAPCDSAWTERALTLGVHDIAVTAHVAGAANDPPPSGTRLRFSCSDPNFDQLDVEADGDADGGAAVDVDGGARGGGASNADGSAAGNGAASDETVVAGCGCSMIGTTGRASALGAMGVAACIALARRRRRTRKR